MAVAEASVGVGRTSLFRDEGGKVRNRREAVAAVRSSGGPLTDSTPALHPLRREALKMPRGCVKRHCTEGDR